MGPYVSKVKISIFGIGFSIEFKGDEVTSKERILAFLNGAGGVEALNSVRENDDVIDKYFNENNIKNIKDTVDIDGWMQDLTNAQADWIIDAFSKYAI